MQPYSSTPCGCFYWGRIYLRWFILLVTAKYLALSAAQTCYPASRIAWINPASIYLICGACSAPERVTVVHLHPTGAFTGSPTPPPGRVVKEAQKVVFAFDSADMVCYYGVCSDIC